MEVSPDFFEYFLAGYTLLKKDPTVVNSYSFLLTAQALVHLGLER